MLVFIESKKPGPVLQEVLTKSAVDQYLYISIHFVTIRGCCVDKILAKLMFPIQTSQAAGKETCLLFPATVELWIEGGSKRQHCRRRTPGHHT